MILSNRNGLKNTRNMLRVFGGLNETYSCTEAEYSAGINFSARNFPALSTRLPRRKLREEAGLNGMYHLNGLLTVCGRDLVFSGDTAPCPALEKAAAGADLLLCDSTYALPEQAAQAKQYGHSTFGQSAALAAKAGAKRLWLVHYSPMITDPEEELAQAQSLFPAAECGYDGKSITLQYEEAEE